MLLYFFTHFHKFFTKKTDPKSIPKRKIKNYKSIPKRKIKNYKSIINNKKQNGHS
jgi:hypothetical protein